MPLLFLCVGVCFLIVEIRKSGTSGHAVNMSNIQPMGQWRHTVGQKGNGGRNIIDLFEILIHEVHDHGTLEFRVCQII